ncbi:MAG: DUF6775 family putative metallopeptidase [Candidatus Helarchaeota archaeon]
MKLSIYLDSQEPYIDSTSLLQFINENFSFLEPRIHKKLLNEEIVKENINEFAKELAAIKVKDIYKPFTNIKPLYGEIEFEKRVIKKNIPVKGILYDGLKLLLLYWDFISQKYKPIEGLAIIITDRLIGTYSAADGRYHIRAILSSRLSLISTSGIVEGPARPKEFYKLKHQMAVLNKNIPLEIIKEQFKNQFIDYNDPRLTEVLKGYISQCIFFNLIGNPFCSDKNCRLFNAHWQEELIHSQLQSRQFCQEHQKYLEKFAKSRVK